jgi:DNA polymerase-1
LLVEQADQARLSRQLATIDRTAPIQFDADAFALTPPQADRLVPLLQELEFSTLLKTLQPGEATAAEAVASVEHISSEADAKRWVASVQPGETVGVSVATGDELGVRASVTGIAFSAAETKAVTARRVERPFRDLLQDRGVVKTAHDWKPALLALSRAGADVMPPCFDTMVADYLLNPNRRNHDLETVVLDVLGHRLGSGVPQPEAQPSQGLFDQPSQVTDRELAEAAIAVRQLAPEMKRRLADQGSLRLFEEVEMPLVPVLAGIERNGFLLDVPALQELGKELERELDRMMGTIATLAGGGVNINSPKQLAVVLFEKLGLKPIRKTKTGYSTDEDTLAQLATQHELPAQILNYRSLSKLKSTYVDALPELVNPETGRLHTSLNQTVAATGRLSSTEPNLQNIPVKGEYGLRIREAFVAPPGHTLVCADYSQIEPRILAHLSRDEKLVRVFEQGQDIHMATAVEIFDKPADQITRDMRRAAKTVVFGIVYGISPFGLSQNIGVSQTEAKQYIDAFFERFAAVRALMDRHIAEGREKGYTTTILGRRRPIPELQSPDPAQRAFGERIAVNSPIQGSAADLIKVAMINVAKRLETDLPTTKMILQVHDELIFETSETDVEKAKQLVKAEMEGVGKHLGLSVPLKVDLGVGKNWRVAHP